PAPPCHIARRSSFASPAASPCVSTRSFSAFGVVSLIERSPMHAPRPQPPHAPLPAVPSLRRTNGDAKYCWPAESSASPFIGTALTPMIRALLGRYAPAL